MPITGIVKPVETVILDISFASVPTWNENGSASFQSSLQLEIVVFVPLFAIISYPSPPSIVFKLPRIVILSFPAPSSMLFSLPSARIVSAPSLP